MSFLSKTGQLLSPFSIFIRAPAQVGEKALLETFGLQNFNPTSDEDASDFCIVASDGTWTVLADCWFYFLWADPQRPLRVEQLASRFDVFTFMCGEADDTYEFVVYRGGRLLRHFKWNEPWDRSSPHGIAADIGERLPGEGSIHACAWPDRLTWLCDEHGTRCQYGAEEVKVYVPDAPRWPRRV